MGLRKKMEHVKNSKQIILEDLRSATVQLSQSALVQEFWQSHPFGKLLHNKEGVKE
jgi:hypothetical protein